MNELAGVHREVPAQESDVLTHLASPVDGSLHMPKVAGGTEENGHEMMTRQTALEILARCSIERGADFHALSSEQIEALLSVVKERKYRKRKDAPGSTARMFHSYVERRAERAS